MKKILVALDGSPRAEGVLRYGEWLARLTGARLILFRCFDVPADMRLAWPLDDEVLEATFRKEAQAYLDNCARTVPSGLIAEVEVRVALGAPWQAVCSIAREANVDLVLIGSHGYRGVNHLLGTTAAKIVNHADRPVLVFRPQPPAS